MPIEKTPVRISARAARDVIAVRFRSVSGRRCLLSAMMLISVLLVSPLIGGERATPGVVLLPMEQDAPQEASIIGFDVDSKGHGVLKYRIVANGRLIDSYYDLDLHVLVGRIDIQSFPTGIDPAFDRQRAELDQKQKIIERELGLDHVAEPTPAPISTTLENWSGERVSPDSDPGFGIFPGGRVLAPVIRELCFVSPLILSIEDETGRREQLSLFTTPTATSGAGPACRTSGSEPAVGPWQVPEPRFLAHGRRLFLAIDEQMLVVDPQQAASSTVVTRNGATLLIARGPDFIDAYARALGLDRNPERCLAPPNLSACRQDQDRFLRAWFRLR